MMSKGQPAPFHVEIKFSLLRAVSPLGLFVAFKSVLIELCHPLAYAVQHSPPSPRSTERVNARGPSWFRAVEPPLDAPKCLESHGCETRVGPIHQPCDKIIQRSQRRNLPTHIS